MQEFPTPISYPYFNTQANFFAMNLHIFLITFLSLIPLTFSSSFNLTSFGHQNTNRAINLTGDAYISNNVIQVTPYDESYSVGRATYIEPLQLWDKNSRNLADFSTHFSFVIDSNGSYLFGDGLAFFMAPFGSNIPGDGAGGGLGLRSYVSSEPFVSVEFDTYINSGWDPLYVHVGININSMESVTTRQWRNNITLGRENDAWISYNASSMTLSVDFTGFSSNETNRDSLSYVVDLREHLPENVTFGFSASTGERFQKNSVKSWDFSSSLQLGIGPNKTIPSAETDASPSPANKPSIVNRGRKGDKRRLVVGLSVGMFVLILASAFCCCCLWKNKKKKESRDGGDFLGPSMNNEFEKGRGAKRFSHEELAYATNNFSDQNKLGHGGFGGVYRGFLRETDSLVAVKRVSRESKQGIKEYASEVKIISQLRHKNLVQLLGWCHERRELLLVYELMPKGSLDSHLFNEKHVLNWEPRHKIAQDLASALLYLHEEWEQCVVHRDVKTSNIMLDASFNAKLGDFGLARLVDHEKGSQTTLPAGTFGYMAPECYNKLRSSKESDVFSFGVVLLEIASGRKACEFCDPENEINLVELVWKLYGIGKILEAADPRLNAQFDEQKMEHLLVVGLWCAHPDNSQRPSIGRAIHVLNLEAPLPILPSTMPVPAYYYPTVTNAVSSVTNDSTSGSIYSNTSNLTKSSASSADHQPVF